MAPPRLNLEVIVSQPFAENSYIAHFERSDACIVFDPGFEPDLIVQHLERKGLTPAAILNTHGHADHIAGNAAMKQRWPDCPLVIGAGDADKLTDPALNLSTGYGIGLTSPPADVTVVEGQTYRAADIDLQVWETPGHSCGHVVFLFRGAEPWMVFGGDVLFRQGVGRSDFPDGDFQQLVSSIQKKLFTLPDDTVILPGHGESTTIGEEKQWNPFVGVPGGYAG